MIEDRRWKIGAAVLALWFLASCSLLAQARFGRLEGVILSTDMTPGYVLTQMTNALGERYWTNLPVSATSGGSVTSVGITPPAWLTAGAPVTNSGSVSLSATTGEPANYVLATPNGTTGPVDLRALVAADIPSLAASKITSGTLDTNRLPALVKDLGALSLSRGDLLQYDGTNLIRLATGTNGQVLTANGAGMLSTFATPSGYLFGGVPNTIPIWLTTNTLGNSVLIDTGTSRLKVTDLTGANERYSTYQFLLPDGLANRPSIAFIGDPTLGLYFPTSGTIGFTANGDLLRLSASAAKFYVPITFATDNSVDIGTSSGVRPRIGYFGTSVVTPTVTITNGAAAGKVWTATDSLGSGAWQTPSSGGVYRDQSIEAGAMFVGNLASPATTGTYTNSQNDTLSDSWTFDDAATNTVRFSLTLPDAWDLSTVKLKLYVTCDGTNAATSTNLVWGVSAGSLGPNEALTNAIIGTEVYVTNGLATAGHIQQVFTTPAITVGGSPALGDSVWFQIAREGGNASDTWTNTPVRLLKARVQWLESTNSVASW